MASSDENFSDIEDEIRNALQQQLAAFAYGEIDDSPLPSESKGQTSTQKKKKRKKKVKNEGTDKNNTSVSDTVQKVKKHKQKKKEDNKIEQKDRSSKHNRKPEKTFEDVDETCKTKKKNSKKKSKKNDANITPKSENIDSRLSGNRNTHFSSDELDDSCSEFDDDAHSDMGGVGYGKDSQMSDCDSNDEEIEQSKKTGQQRHLEDLKRKLGLTDKEIKKLKEKKAKTLMKVKNASAPSAITPSQIAQRKRPPPEVVVFNDPAKRKKVVKDKTSVKTGREIHKRSQEDDENSDNEFDLKQARYEIQKYGIKGMDTLSKEEATVSMLVKLGAEPPKKKSINYKELVEMKKKEKEEDIKQRAIQRSLGYKVTSSGKKKIKKKKDINDVGYLDGQIGNYKQGAQFVSGQDIKATTKKSRK